MASDPSTGTRLERFVRARWTRRDGGIRKLAEQAGIDKDTIYAWFRGDGEPSLTALRGLARALKVPRSEIVAAMDAEAYEEAAPPRWAERPLALVNLMAQRSGITEAEIQAEADRLLAAGDESRLRPVPDGDVKGRA